LDIPAVIIDFANAEKIVGNLGEERIPSWTTPTLEVPVVEVPARSLTRAKKPEDKVIPELSEDAEMEDVGDPAPELTPTGRAKRRPIPTLKARALQRASEEMVVPSGDEGRSVSSSGAKRALEDSPSRVEKTSKKKKTGTKGKGKGKTKEKEKGKGKEKEKRAKRKKEGSVSGSDADFPEIDVNMRVNLEGWSFEEDTEIDPEIVPGSYGKVMFFLSLKFSES